MTVFALVPVHNRLEDTKRVIACLRRQTYSPLKIVVIDDGSIDGTSAFLAQQQDIIGLRGNGSLWWAGAIQLGLDYVLPLAQDSDYVVLVNNDTTFDQDLVARLVRVSRGNGGAVVGSLLRDIDQPQIVHGLAPVVDVWSLRVWELYHVLPEQERQNLKPLYEVDALSGRGTLYPVRAFKVGGQMRPRVLPHYYADYELAMRMKREGVPVVVSTEAVVYSRNDFSVQGNIASWFETFFGNRSHRNVLQRAVFWSAVGTPLQRLTAILRMAWFPLERGMCRVRSRLARAVRQWSALVNGRLRKPMYRFVKMPIARWLKKVQYIDGLRREVRKRGRNLRIIVGASGSAAPDWISTEYPFVDITDRRSLLRLFKPGEVSALLAEHVWEHLTPEQARNAARSCFTLLKPGGHIRVAVPDGNHPDPEYIDYVRPGGHGAGADDHKVLYTLDSLSEVFSAVGFQVRPLEWFDASGTFHAIDWDPKDGYVSRSTRFDERNREKRTAYTSLIIDAVKPSHDGSCQQA